MDKTLPQNIVINDLLSFLTCKTKLVPKEKLLNCISNYYSESAITDAQKNLLAALPIKKSTRHGRRVKHPDPLVAIYDCIQLIPKEDLPTFVCKDLNNVPFMKNVKTESKEKENPIERLKEKEPETEEDEEDEMESMDEDLYRREQKQMRSQISEMFSIITELKDGLQKYTETPRVASKTKSMEGKKDQETSLFPSRNLVTPKNIILSSSKSTEDDIEEEEDGDDNEKNSDSEVDSKLDGLALIQKLIDEDDESNKLDLLEMEDDTFDSDEDSEYMDELDLDESHMSKEGTKSEPTFTVLKPKESEFPVLQARTASLSSKKPAIVVAPSIGGQKVIYIKNEFREVQSNGCSDGDKSVAVTSDIIENQVKMESSAELPQRNSCDSKENEGSESETELQKSESSFKGVHNQSQLGYQCPICGVLFDIKFNYDTHVETHIKKGTYDCPLCCRGFESRQTFSLGHFVKCVEEAKKNGNWTENICPVCDSFFADQNSFEKHKSLHSDCKPFQCTQCKFRFFTKHAIEIHVKNQHNDLNKHLCPLCHQSFICNTDLLEHMGVHTGVKPFMCCLCDYRSSKKKNVKKHLRSHGKRKVKKLKCKECDFTCAGPYKLLNHRLKKHREPISCSVCGKTFKNPYLYKKHYEVHKEVGKYKCLLCLYSSSFKQAFERHMLTHASDNEFECPECNVPLASNQNIYWHLRKYCTKEKPETNLRNYECDLCLYFTPLKQAFDKHMLIHTSSNDFKCPVCNIPLASKQNIGWHLRSYCSKENPEANLKKFDCKMCLYSSPSKRAFDKHMLTHTAGTEFECPECAVPLPNHQTVILHLQRYCSKDNIQAIPTNYECKMCLYSTNLKRSLVKHMLTHTSGKDIECPECNISLPNKQNVGKHLRNYCTVKRPRLEEEKRSVADTDI